jgi:hypothetical protein
LSKAIPNRYGIRNPNNPVGEIRNPNIEIRNNVQMIEIEMTKMDSHQNDILTERSKGAGTRSHDSAKPLNEEP